MGILLSEQLEQSRQLREVSYHVPIFDKKYYDASNHSEGRKAGKSMFYDFYAMEFLWSFLGSGQIPKAERKKLAAMDPNDPRRDIVTGISHKFLPEAAVKAIDSMYEQVTNAVAKNLLSYVRLAVVQEFQYLVSQSYGWTHFRQALVSKYNKKKTITREDFNKLVKEYIPEMSPYPDTIKRLLKYSKYYSEMHTSDDKDVFDVTRDIDIKADSAEPEISPPQAPAEPDIPKVPDETDYGVPPTKREFGKYGPENPSPYEQPWSGLSAFKDVEKLPEIPSGDEDDGEDDVKEPLTEEFINPSKVKKVYAAINKAGITLDDIVKAYNHVPWGGAYGGPKWGEGALSLLKLAHAKRNFTTDDMNHIIDHIYDLQHNTGSLLNKGPMYIGDTDLNRRYKITDIARFIPFVSPVIKNFIRRYQKFLHSDPVQAALEANMENIIKSPTLPLDPEEIKKLTELGFVDQGGNQYKVGIKFKDKKGESVSGVYYSISKREAGTFDEKNQYTKTPNAPPLYVISDNLMADIKAYPTFQEAFNYLMGYKSDMIAPGSSGYVASPIQSEKDIYISSHNKIKLPPDKEQLLLNFNLGWRKSKKYKAYFSDGHRFLFFAFSDGTYLLYHDNNPSYQVFHDFLAALDWAKIQTVNANPYPEKEQAQAEINAALGKPVSKKPSATTVPKTQEYYLAPESIASIETLVKALPQTTHEKYFWAELPNGMPVVVHQKYAQAKNVFAVGNTLKATYGNPYKVVHFLTSGPASESWTFGTWTATYNFIKDNLSFLINTGMSKAFPISQQSGIWSSLATKDLPPNATSKSAYSVHVGIEGAPKHTIRLTKDDETALSSIGFSPKLIGTDVWYIHKSAGDTIKFFPNNTAKVLFTSKTISSLPAVNFSTIEKALQWLPTKYTLGTIKSPISSPSTGAVPPKGTPEKGVKAGTMFEKTIKDAGFDFDDMGMEYVDYKGDKLHNAPNILKIYPDRSSTLNISGGPEKNFPNLASLVAYLKSDYPAQKKSSPVNPPALPVGHWSKISEINKLLNAQHYFFGGMNNMGGQTYQNPSGDSIVFYNDGKSNVYDAKHSNAISFINQDELITYLKEKYGSIKSEELPMALSPDEVSTEEKNAVKSLANQFPDLNFNTTGIGVLIYRGISPKYFIQKKDNKYILDYYDGVDGEWKNVPGNGSFYFSKILTQLENILNSEKSSIQKSTSPGWMSKDEEDSLEALAKGMGFKTKKGYLTEAVKPQLQYVTIYDKDDKPIYAVAKQEGEYVIYKVIDNTWDKQYTNSDFEETKEYLQILLKGKGTSLSKLTPDQLEWIETYVSNNVDNVNIIKSPDQSITIHDKNQNDAILFTVSKSPDTEYTVRYYFYDPPTKEFKYSFDTFDTFENLASAIENKLGTYVKLKYTAEDNLDKMESILADYGYEYDSATSVGMSADTGASNFAYTYDNGQGEKIILFSELPDAKYISVGKYEKDFDSHSELKTFLDTKIFGSSGSSEKTMTTGDSELDELLNKSGYRYQGSKSLDPLSKVYVNKETNGNLIIYQDSSISFVENEKFVPLGNLFELKTYLKAKLSNVAGEPKEDPPTLPPPSDYDYAEFGKISGFPPTLTIGLISQDTEILKKLGFNLGTEALRYINKDGEYFVVFADGSSTFNSPKAFKNPAQSFKTAKQAIQWAIDHYSTGTYKSNKEIKRTSILTYEEAKPIMTSKLPDALSPAVPKSYDDISFHLAGKFPSEIVVRNNFKYKFSIGKLPHEAYGEIWHITQIETDGKHIIHEYTFVTLNNLLQFVKGHATELLNNTVLKEQKKRKSSYKTLMEQFI